MIYENSHPVLMLRFRGTVVLAGHLVLLSHFQIDSAFILTWFVNCTAILVHYGINV